jgi:hypothetical protein
MGTSGICSDLVVVELGDGRVGSSLAGMILADNGARVLKVESASGDRFREELPSGWLVWNRGKESVVVDRASSDGRELVARLLRSADVVIDGDHPGVVEALGLGEEHIRAASPSIVWASITSFGPESDLSRVPADDALVMAKAGVFARGFFAFREGPIFSGACTTALVVHSLYRVAVSQSAASDPFRARALPSYGGARPWSMGTDGYASFASRYLHEYGATKENFGLVAITVATTPHAILMRQCAIPSRWTTISRRASSGGR